VDIVRSQTHAIYLFLFVYAKLCCILTSQKICFFISIPSCLPITVAILSSPAQTVVCIVDCNFTPGMNVSVFIPCLYVAALPRADPPSEECYRLYRVKKLKNRQRPNTGLQSRNTNSIDNNNNSLFSLQCLSRILYFSLKLCSCFRF
jgi:hypothetical protein